jgi:L,D-transpeptidase catalytic domain
MRRLLVAGVAAWLLAAPGARAAEPAHAPPFAAHLLTRAAPVHVRPAARSRRVDVLRQFRWDYRRTVVLAIGRRTRGGRRWYRVRLIGRPNGRTGWVQGRRLERVRSVRRTRLVIDLSERRMRVRRGGRPRRSFPIAIGAPGTPTPTGRFYLAAAWRPAESLYGAWAIETSAGAVLTDWPGGGVIGIHGTNQPWLIGQAVSHGCVRMRNGDILRLRRLAPLGTRLSIRP